MARCWAGLVAAERHPGAHRLSTVVGQLTEIARRNQEALAADPTRPPPGGLADTFLLANEALALFNEIKPTAVEQLVVATSLLHAGEVSKARPLVAQAKQNAIGLQEQLTAARTAALLEFVADDLEAGRREYAAAEALVTAPEHAGLPPNSVAAYSARTQYEWAILELGVGQCGPAREHLDAATAALAGLAASAQTQQFRTQLDGAYAQPAATCP